MSKNPNDKQNPALMVGDRSLARCSPTKRNQFFFFIVPHSKAKRTLEGGKQQYILKATIYYAFRAYARPWLLDGRERNARQV